jgi:hypothetical protein
MIHGSSLSVEAGKRFKVIENEALYYFHHPPSDSMVQINL